MWDPPLTVAPDCASHGEQSRCRSVVIVFAFETGGACTIRSSACCSSPCSLCAGSISFCQRVCPSRQGSRCGQPDSFVQGGPGVAITEHGSASVKEASAGLQARNNDDVCFSDNIGIPSALKCGLAWDRSSTRPGSIRIRQWFAKIQTFLSAKLGEGKGEKLVSACYRSGWFAAVKPILIGGLA